MCKIDASKYFDPKTEIFSNEAMITDRDTGVRVKVDEDTEKIKLLPHHTHSKDDEDEIEKYVFSFLPK